MAFQWKRQGEPRVSLEELEKAIEQYNSRDRRYGGIKEDEENV